MFRTALKLGEGLGVGTHVANESILVDCMADRTTLIAKLPAVL